MMKIKITGKQKDYFRTQVRFPPKLYAEIKKNAERSGRSINAEIIYRLENFYR